MKSNTGATTGIRAVLAATNGACATTPVDPMTADPTPVPMVISVWGLTVARNTLPASRDDAAVLPAPRSVAARCSRSRRPTGTGALRATMRAVHHWPPDRGRPGRFSRIPRA